ncbi:MAG: hypothetical protein H7X91_12240 [Burkholderiales bacterium]|nr:hypothetical protein [Burkholderiales bacterium]
MKLSSLKYIAAALLMVGAQQTFAAGTLSGADVNNTATINYQVGGVAQPAQPSNTATFKVDRKVNLTVAEVGTADTTVTPGSTNQAVTFTVTNTANAALDFALTVTQDATNATTAHGGTDDFDVTNVRFFLESGATAGFQAGEDTQITFLDEIAADATFTVHVVADIPNAQANGNQSGLTLTATSREAGTAAAQGAAITETAGADTPGAVDTVFADGAGDTDAARDGAHSDDDAFLISAAQITAAKSSRVISDPSNGTTNPKAIPGAVVEYCIAVTNAAGGAAATNVTVADALAGQPVTYVAASITLGATNCTATDGVAKTDAADADEASFAANTTTGSFASVPAGSTVVMQFRVTIN